MNQQLHLEEEYNTAAYTVASEDHSKETATTDNKNALKFYNILNDNPLGNNFKFTGPYNSTNLIFNARPRHKRLPDNRSYTCHRHIPLYLKLAAGYRDFFTRNPAIDPSDPRVAALFSQLNKSKNIVEDIKTLAASLELSANHDEFVVALKKYLEYITLDCPICAELDKLKASKHDVYPYEANYDYFANVVCLNSTQAFDKWVASKKIEITEANVASVVEDFNVLHAAENYYMGIQIARFTPKTYKKLLALENHPMLGGYVFSRNKGLALSITLKQTVGKNNQLRSEYDIQNLGIRGPIHSNPIVYDYLVANLYDLDVIFRPVSYDVLTSDMVTSAVIVSNKVLASKKNHGGINISRTPSPAMFYNNTKSLPPSSQSSLAPNSIPDAAKSVEILANYEVIKDKQESVPATAPASANSEERIYKYKHKVDNPPSCYGDPTVFKPHNPKCLACPAVLFCSMDQIV